MADFPDYDHKGEHYAPGDIEHGQDRDEERPWPLSLTIVPCLLLVVCALIFAAAIVDPHAGRQAGRSL